MHAPPPHSHCLLANHLHTVLSNRRFLPLLRQRPYLKPRSSGRRCGCVPEGLVRHTGSNSLQFMKFPPPFNIPNCRHACYCHCRWVPGFSDLIHWQYRFPAHTAVTVYRVHQWLLGSPQVAKAAKVELLTQAEATGFSAETKPLSRQPHSVQPPAALRSCKPRDIRNHPFPTTLAPICSFQDL